MIFYLIGLELLGLIIGAVAFGCLLWFRGTGRLNIRGFGDIYRSKSPIAYWFFWGLIFCVGIIVVAGPIVAAIAFLRK